ncbi:MULTISPECIES: ribonuclease R [unclassified Granulicatella]|uniref:ribonuclease R n=1 Tax=unclassified Granulicatella TaxID=2630493 RepID=UPI0010734286|nr:MULTISPECIES: ribonuclease R [unclassified Granulicatella]MBF0780034.1 ribonuclease R [Granulicatella sp. 19428wC4_WM01]TFU95883.1 ribonuclease R [Granulicatella sp. WM01]
MKEQIIKVLEQKSMTTHELAETLHMSSSHDYSILIKQIALLERLGDIQITKNGYLKVTSHTSEYVEGYYRAHEKGFGFVQVDGQDEDIYIPKGMQLALSGDKVRVMLTKESDIFAGKGAEGIITDILERAMTTLVGEFVKYPQHLIEETGFSGYVVPKIKQMMDYTCFIEQSSLQVVDGTICLVDITRYPTEDNPKNLFGVIVKEIGYKDEPGVDILTILHKRHIPVEFPEKVLEEANRFSIELSSEDIKDRLDLRHEKIVTIDGQDAKDLDDAISVKYLDNGLFELGVHIADVSTYVKEDSGLDKEAYLRGTSVYLSDRVVPMLPQRLSNGICSLHPDEDRLTLSCIMQLDASGNVHEYCITPSVIRSCKRMSYERVNEAIVQGNKRAREEYEDVLDMLELMRDIHYALYHKRHRRGAIDFDTNEAKILVDENGKPLDIILRERGLAERMIESFMLCANETIAKHFMEKQYPFIYRVHEQPAEDKMQRFLEFTTTFGIMIKGTSSTINSKTLQKVLEKLENQPYEALVSTMLLRSMKQARYDEQPLGHFGLATTHYTHFTSPIRRYPDLIVHRFIKKYAKCPPLTEEFDSLHAKLEDIAQQSSAMERRSVEAERETEAMKKAEYMLDKLGQKFTGVISSVTRFGMFVELPNTVEGLIHVSKMEDDHYDFIENHLLLVGKRTGKTYQIGQELTVKVSKVDVETYEIDFDIVYSKEDKIRQKISKKRVKKQRTDKKKEKRKTTRRKK